MAAEARGWKTPKSSHTGFNTRQPTKTIDEWGMKSPVQRKPVGSAYICFSWRTDHRVGQAWTFPDSSHLLATGTHQFMLLAGLQGFAYVGKLDTEQINIEMK